MSIDKSTRQHYAMQGKVKNYLGKQKMVKAPKYWLSKPDHVKAKLAYITDEEEKILIDKNLYGSLRGRPNIGPAGLPSLQGGDSGGLGGGGGKGGGGEGGWNPGVAAEERAKSKAASDRARANAREMAIQTAAKSTKSTKTGPSETRDGPRHHTVDTPTQKKEQKVADELNRQNAIRDMIAQQQEEKYGPTVDPTKFGETVEDKVFKNHPEYKEQEAKRAIKQLSTKAGTQEALREFKALKTGREYSPNISLLDKLNVSHSFTAPETPKKGLWGTLGNVALGILAPQLLGPKLGQLWSGYNQLKNISKLASNFTGKDYVGDLTKNLRSNISTSNLTGKKSTATDTRDDRFGQGDKGEGKQVVAAPKADVVSQNIQKFSPRQMDLVRQRYDQLQQVMQTGMYNGQRLNNNQLANLQNTSKQMQAFLVDPQKTMMMARGGIAGLHG